METYELFNTNFQRHYTTNRAPFYMLLEEQWLANGTYYKGRLQVKTGHLFQKAKKGLSTSSFRRPASDVRLPTSTPDFRRRIFDSEVKNLKLEVVILKFFQE